MSDPFAWCAGELAALEAAGLRRHPVSVSSAPGPEAVIAGRRVVQLCSNDYLGLAGDPRVRAAAAAAAGRWGAGAGASRLVNGTLDLHRELEVALAAHEGCEDAIVFSSGYLAAAGTIAALVGRQDAVFSDALNHASLIDGCRLSGARAMVYPHGDIAFLAAALAATPARRRLVVTDSVFSMDGDLAPLAALVALCEAHGAMLMVDEAHATGVLGPLGGGAVALAGLAGRVGVVMGTLSKALGAAGGFIAGSSDLVAWLRNRARSYMFDTAPVPAAMGAALAALRIARQEPRRRERVLAAAQGFATDLAAMGYDVAAPAAAIVPVMIGDAAEAVAISERLLAAGILVPAIRPPSVPAGSARLRVTLTAAHTAEHLGIALEAFAAARPAGAGSVSGRNSAPNTNPAGLDRRITAAAGVFVTGTGTGVGKTVVAAALATAWAAGGQRVGVLKPAQTGAAEGADDLAFIRNAAGLAARDCVAPYVMPAPLAPAVCARLEGQPVTTAPIVAAFEALRARCDVVIVEGAGGLLVPLHDTATMADLAGALGLPLLVVAPPGLGTLNHTALTAEAARARGLDVLGIALCGFPAAPGLAEATNPAELERLTGAPLLAVVPELACCDVDRGRLPATFEPASWLSPALGGTFDRTTFLSGLELVHDHA